MNKIYTIGFTKETLKDFIRRLEKAGVQRIIDIRLNNLSQLSGFAKSPDLEYILQLRGSARARDSGAVKSSRPTIPTLL